LIKEFFSKKDELDKRKQVMKRIMHKLEIKVL